MHSPAGVKFQKISEYFEALLSLFKAFPVANLIEIFGIR
jgi:hypothetical protein